MVRKKAPIEIFLILFLIVGIVRCSKFNQETADPLFQQLTPYNTGVKFSNDITYDRDFNVNDFSYLYNGGGVAVGDINNDGLPDLYFSGNMMSSRLYLNKGNFEFEDITDLSDTGTENWAGGVSMVDINNDGYLDIYVSVNGPEGSTPEERKNLLFINNQDSTFTEAAEKFGLVDTGYTVHSAFFDYDTDGDLDVYLMNNFAGSFARENQTGSHREKDNLASKNVDALYRNNGDNTFTEVSEQAGITEEGYGLGIAVSDINRDGHPDVYISNDGQPDDLLYINNRDGTFTDQSSLFFKHTSYAGMGIDIADFNNDIWPDVLQVDMMPPNLKNQQLVSGARDYDYLMKLEQEGYQPQYTLNTLQLSNGIDEEGNIIFSEISRLAGVAYTDWSWSGLFGDYDNDGLKDIMITNGYPKALNNFDYITEISNSSMFGTDSTRADGKFGLMDEVHAIKVPNYLYKNNGDLTFTDVSEKWGFTNSSFSYGAIQADLDNDGDLDIAVNNINRSAGIYENTADSVKDNRYLAVNLTKDSLNTYGIGSKIILSVDGEKQFKYFSPYRGYQSSVGHRIHFGLGDYQFIDSLEVIWPDGKYQLVEKVSANQLLTIKYNEAKQRESEKSEEDIKNRSILDNAGKELGIEYKHKENNYVDFDEEPLLTHMFSRFGPPIAVGDVTGNELNDFYVGGAAGSSGTLFIQQEDGSFKESIDLQPWAHDQDSEDTDAIFFDANGDGNLDLYVVSGGNEFSPVSTLLQDRLYLNSGDGQFAKAERALPRMHTSGSVVKSVDYDKDGESDLFVGGMIVPGQYPKPAKSYILQNNEGKFIDVTSEIAPDLVEPGMLTDAVWIDFNEDGNMDLVTSGIWMPISFFENKSGKFENITSSLDLEQNVGWWYSLEKGDIDKDGDTDLVAGNLGQNHNYSAPGSLPLEIFAHDFDGNRHLDAILTVKKGNQNYPVHPLRNMRVQFRLLMQRFRTFEEYANTTLSEMVGKEPMQNALRYRAEYFASSIIENKDDGSFSMRPLHNEAQTSSVNDILLKDINGDENLDLLLAGNIYETNTRNPEHDASNGVLLLGNGEGDFDPISPFISEFLAPLNVKELKVLNTISNKFILVANNNDSLQVVSLPILQPQK